MCLRKNVLSRLNIIKYLSYKNWIIHSHTQINIKPLFSLNLATLCRPLDGANTNIKLLEAPFHAAVRRSINAFPTSSTVFLLKAVFHKEFMNKQCYLLQNYIFLRIKIFIKLWLQNQNINVIINLAQLYGSWPMPKILDIIFILKSVPKSVISRNGYLMNHLTLHPFIDLRNRMQIRIYIKKANHKWIQIS